MTRSIRSHAEGRDCSGSARLKALTACHGGSERGAATSEFVMVSALLVLLSFAILQLTLVVHVRNTLVDAASSGARFGVLEDRTAADGVERTRALIESSISSRYAEGVGYEYVDQAEGQILRITVQAQVPLVGMLPGVSNVEVTGSAYEFE